MAVFNIKDLSVTGKIVEVDPPHFLIAMAATPPVFNAILSIEPNTENKMQIIITAIVAYLIGVLSLYLACKLFQKTKYAEYIMMTQIQILNGTITMGGGLSGSKRVINSSDMDGIWFEKYPGLNTYTICIVSSTFGKIFRVIQVSDNTAILEGFYKVPVEDKEISLKVLRSHGYLLAVQAIIRGAFLVVVFMGDMNYIFSTVIIAAVVQIALSSIFKRQWVKRISIDTTGLVVESMLKRGKEKITDLVIKYQPEEGKDVGGPQYLTIRAVCGDNRYVFMVECPEDEITHVIEKLREVGANIEAV
jgi:hypothetical protein